MMRGCVRLLTALRALAACKTEVPEDLHRCGRWARPRPRFRSSRLWTRSWSMLIQNRAQ